MDSKSQIQPIDRRTTYAGRLARALLVTSLLLPAAWLAAGAGASAGGPGEGGSAWSKKLRNGRTVELVGLSTYPSGDETWWSPSGGPLRERPYEKFGSEFQFAGRLTREVVVRLSGFGDEDRPSVSWAFTPAASSGTGSLLGADDEATRALSAVVAGLPMGSKTCDIRVGVASGPWKTLAQAARGGSTSSATDEGEVMIARSRPTDRGARVVIADTVKGVETRVVVIDGDGEEHASSAGSASSSQNLRLSDLEFDVPPDEIEEVRFQIRSYEWAEFKDVPLRPGEGGE